MRSTRSPGFIAHDTVQPIENALVDNAHGANPAVLVGVLLRGEAEVLVSRTGERVIHGPGVVKEVVMRRIANQRRALDLVCDG
jgi:hypothetical protein